MNVGISCVVSAYGCEGKGEEDSRERHNGVEAFSPLTFLPLNIAGGNKETKKDTYTTDRQRKSPTTGDKPRRSPYNMHCKKAPTKNAVA